VQWRNIPVLCFHRFSPAAAPDSHFIGDLGRSLDLIARLGFSTIRAADLYGVCLGRRPAPRRSVVLTFDDGTLDHWLHVAPELARRSMHGVFFVITDLLHDGPPRTAAEAPPPTTMNETFLAAMVKGDPRHFMRRSEARALVQDFGMEVYSHSAGHRPCFRSLEERGTLSTYPGWAPRALYRGEIPELPVYRTGSAYVWNGFEVVHDGVRVTLAPRTNRERVEFCLTDFRRSLADIRAINDAETQLFGWPWGASDALAVGALRDAGFDGAFTLERTFNGTGTDPFRLARLRIRPRCGPLGIAAHLLLHATRIGPLVQGAA
jgi:peptidoglycan/xylan/chitin deacetylase (PgdA/CDA1 family)